MTEYIEREALNALLLEECSPKVAAYLIDAAAAIPAADVRPVVRGKWKPHKTKTGKNWWKCSACDYVSEHKAHHNFCPNCGAKMEES